METLQRSQVASFVARMLAGMRDICFIEEANWQQWPQRGYSAMGLEVSLKKLRSRSPHRVTETDPVSADRGVSSMAPCNCARLLIFLLLPPLLLLYQSFSLSLTHIHTLSLSLSLCSVISFYLSFPLSLTHSLASSLFLVLSFITF